MIYQRKISMHRKASFVAVLGDDANAIGLHRSTDEHVDVVLAEFPHQSHLLHSFSADFTTFGKVEIFDAYNRSSVLGHFGEHLVRCHTSQTQLSTTITTIRYHCITYPLPNYLIKLHKIQNNVSNCNQTRCSFMIRI